MKIIKALCFVVLASCTDASQTIASQQVQIDSPCEIEVLTSDVPELVSVRYNLLCPDGQFSASILEVSSNIGNWGDVTRWVLCGHNYIEEFTNPRIRASAAPWAILSVFDGNGGDITSCRTPNAPSD